MLGTPFLYCLQQLQYLRSIASTKVLLIFLPCPNADFYLFCGNAIALADFASISSNNFSDEM
jgi:hypothetical protein